MVALRGGRGNAADGGRTAGSAIVGQVVGADGQLDPAHRQAESFGRHLGDDGAGAGAEILGADFDGDGAIRVDHAAALALMAAAGPGVHGDAEAALDRTRATLPAGLPELLPFRQLGSFPELVAIEFDARFGRVLRVLEEDFERVEARPGRPVLHRRPGQIRGLLLVGRAPGALRAGVDRNRGVVDAGIGDAVDYIRAAAGRPPRRRAARAPRVGLPGGDGAVLGAAQLDPCKSRGAGCRRSVDRWCDRGRS